MNDLNNYKSNKNTGFHEQAKPIVMVVDDEDSVLRTLGFILEDEGYQVKLCSTGKEAIDKLNKNINAVILDINMPDLTGFQIFEKIKAKNPYVPIIFHTAFAKKEDRKDIRRQFRPHAYVIKGSDPDQLLDTVASAVEAHKNIIENIRFNEELTKRNEEIDELNRNLEEKVKNQVDEIQRINRLKRYFSPQIVDAVISKGNEICLENSRKLLTIFFSDIRGFTSMTENLEPEDTISLLNEYFSKMTRLIFKYGGMIDKFMGDGILAFFGDPLEIKDHAEKAIRTAIEMKSLVNTLQPKWEDIGCNLSISIGISTGYVTVGNIGSEERMEYTVIGNHVNLAQRLQSEAKNDQILISQRTYSMAKNVFKMEKIQNINLKGLHNPVVAYNVLGTK
ncbi:MAG: adenylate/guanylate cyclase domain-containing protein [Candidatus Scalinduaceae bacterium]